MTLFWLSLYSFFSLPLCLSIFVSLSLFPPLVLTLFSSFSFFLSLFFSWSLSLLHVVSLPSSMESSPLLYSSVFPSPSIYLSLIICLIHLQFLHRKPHSLPFLVSCINYLAAFTLLYSCPKYHSITLKISLSLSLSLFSLSPCCRNPRVSLCPSFSSSLFTPPFPSPYLRLFSTYYSFFTPSVLYGFWKPPHPTLPY